MISVGEDCFVTVVYSGGEPFSGPRCTSMLNFHAGVQIYRDDGGNRKHKWLDEASYRIHLMSFRKLAKQIHGVKARYRRY